MQDIKTQFEPIKRSTMDVNETAKYLGISVDMVRLLVKEKRLTHFRVGRRILFKKTDCNMKCNT